jgi:triacylglycerol lipase
MPFDPQFTINVMWPAANAAYTIMFDPHPALPAGYSLVGPIIAQSQCAADVAAMTHPDQMQMAHSMLTESNVFGLVAWNAAEKTALVSIRGTQTVHDWIDNLDAVAVPYNAVPEAGLVHMGFQLVYEHIRQNVGKLLTSGCPGVQRILVTGHSLGGAVAVLAALDIAKNVRCGVVPELHSFAGPRAGAPGFERYFNQHIPVCNRIVNFMDVVPQVPLPPLYEHVGQEELVRGGFKPLDVVYAHRMTTYLIGLQQLATPPAPRIA